MTNCCRPLPTAQTCATSVSSTIWAGPSMERNSGRRCMLRPIPWRFGACGPELNMNTARPSRCSGAWHVATHNQACSHEAADIPHDETTCVAGQPERCVRCSCRFDGVNASRATARMRPMDQTHCGSGAKTALLQSAQRRGGGPQQTLPVSNRGSDDGLGSNRSAPLGLRPSGDLHTAGAADCLPAAEAAARGAGAERRRRWEWQSIAAWRAGSPAHLTVVVASSRAKACSDAQAACHRSTALIRGHRNSSSRSCSAGRPAVSGAADVRRSPGVSCRMADATEGGWQQRRSLLRLTPVLDSW